MNDALDMTAPPSVYQQRRAQLSAKLKRPMVFFAGTARPRQHATNTHPFRAGSSYLYFGGPPIEGAALIIDLRSDGELGATLLRHPSDVEDAVWVGAGPSDEDIAAAAGIWKEEVRAPHEITKILGDRNAAYVTPPCSRTMDFIQSVRLHPAKDEELQAIIDMRLTKDEYELDAMRKAARIGVEAHLAAIKAASPGRSEADVAAALTSVLVANRAVPSFTPIVTVRGEVLHSEVYRNQLETGQLLLVDAGAEETGGYASDITRTVPVGGQFSDTQRQLYETVLRAQRETIAACVPGKRFRDIHDLAGRIICEGLVKVDLLRGDPDELAARGAHTLFFTHGLGHLIGLDVHDMEDFGDLAGYEAGRTRRSEFGHKFLRLDRDLKPGMAVTIEPGVYIVPAIWQQESLTKPFADVVNRPAVDTLLDARFGGIRIEDTIVVRDATATGPENLTEAVPTDPDAVAALVGQA